MTFKNMNIKKWILFFLALVPSLAFADDETARSEVVAIIHHVVIYTGQFIAVLLFISAGYKMKMKADAGNSGNFKTGSIYVTLIAATLMLNYSNTLTTYIATLLGNGTGHCFILDESQSLAQNCWDASSSELTGDLRTRIENLSSSTVAESFMKNLNVIVGIFQVIGLIYFFVGVYGLVQVSNGSARDHGYGKPIITMIAAALIVDLPHTAEMFITTLNSVGINF